VGAIFIVDFNPISATFPLADEWQSINPIPKNQRRFFGAKKKKKKKKKKRTRESMDDLATFLDVAVAVVMEAATLFRTHFACSKKLESTHKSPTDLVTEVCYSPIDSKFST